MTLSCSRAGRGERTPLDAGIYFRGTRRKGLLPNSLLDMGLAGLVSGLRGALLMGPSLCHLIHAIGRLFRFSLVVPSFAGNFPGGGPSVSS